MSVHCCGVQSRVGPSAEVCDAHHQIYVIWDSITNVLAANRNTQKVRKPKIFVIVVPNSKFSKQIITTNHPL